MSNYGRTDVFEQKLALQLATAVVNRSDQISEAIATKGHTFHFDARDTRKSPIEQYQGLDDTHLQVVEVAAMSIGNDEPEGTIEIRQVPDNPKFARASKRELSRLAESGLS